jgi:hypothetical protein
MKTTYVWDKERGELVPLEKRAAAPGVRVRKDAYKGIDGQGAVVTQIKRWHPAVLAAGVPVNAKGRAVVTSAAERDRLMDAYNRHEESRSGRQLVWTREAEDDDDSRGEV